MANFIGNNQPFNNFESPPPSVQPDNNTASRSPSWSSLSQSSLQSSFEFADDSFDVFDFDLASDPFSEPSSSQTQPPISPRPPPLLPLENTSVEHYSDFYPLIDEEISRHSPRPRPSFRESGIVDLTSTSPAEMPTESRKRKSDNTTQTPKRRKGHQGLDLRLSPSPTDVKPKAEGIEELDLVEVDDDDKLEKFRAQRQADLLRQQQHEEAEKPIRLAAFQCIICLDSPTDLTVTHCGHMFCSICLHEALHAGTHKRVCPVCRATIGTVKTGGKQPKNGFYALEMKLMTAKRKGKQPEIAP